MIVRFGRTGAGVTLMGPGDEVFGFPHDAFTPPSHKFASILHPDDLPRLQTQLEKALKEGSGTCSYRVRHADGRYRHWHEELRWLPADGKHPDRWVGCAVQGNARGPGARLTLIARERLEGFIQGWSCNGDVSDPSAGSAVPALPSPNEIRLEYALQGATDGLWDWELDTDEVYYSPRWKELLGYADHELTSHLSTWKELVHPEDGERTLRAASRFVGGLESRFEVEFRMRHKDGHWVDLLSRAALVRDARGRPWRLVGTHLDITARKETEGRLRQANEQLQGSLQQSSVDFQRAVAALRASESRLRLALLASGAGAWRWEVATNACWWDARYCEQYGFAVDGDCSHEQWIERVHPEDRERLVRRINVLLQPSDDNLWNEEFRILHPLLGLRWMSGLGQVDRDARGGAVRFHGISLDITERKLVEETLRQSEAKVRRLIGTMRDGFVSVDMSGRIVDCNSAYETMLGYSLAELQERTYIDLTPEKWHEFEACLVREQILPRGYSDLYEKEYRRADGRVFPIELRAVLLTDTQNQPVGIWAVVRDTTARKQAEQDLRDSEERLRLAMMAANQGFYDLNVQTGDCVVSPEYARMLGYEPDEFVETNAAWVERLHPADRESTARIYREYVAGEHPVYSVEFRQRTKQGDWKWILSLGKIVSHSADGQPLRMLGTHTDITSRKQAERDHENQHRLLRAVIDSSEDLIFVKDRALRTVLCNAAFARSLGKTPAETCGNSDLENGWPAKLIPSFEQQDRAVLSGEVMRNPCDEASIAGERRSFDTTKVPVRDAAGEIVGVLGVSRDVTLRQKMEEELKQLNQNLEDRVARRTESLRLTEQRFRALAEATFEGVVLSRRRVILDCNEPFAKLLASTREALVGRKITDFIPPEWNERVVAKILAGDESHFEHELVTADGRRRMVEIHGRSPDGPGGVRLTAVRDITERRQQEVELAAQREELRRFQRLSELSEVSAGVIHQIGQPLTAIMNNVSAARAMVSRCTNPQCNAVDALLDSDACLKQVRVTMDRLRNLAHPERARREPQDVNAIVTEALGWARTAAEAAGIELRPVLGTNLPAVAVDDVQLCQALINLLANACDAVAVCDPSRRAVTIGTYLDDSDNLLIDVSDRGPGLAAGLEDKVFDPFLTTKPDGTGVGLSLCRTIIKAHGGTITAFNREDAPGATFRIKLPVTNGGRP